MSILIKITRIYLTISFLTLHQATHLLLTSFFVSLSVDHIDWISKPWKEAFCGKDELLLNVEQAKSPVYIL